MSNLTEKIPEALSAAAQRLGVTTGTRRDYPTPTQRTETITQRTPAQRPTVNRAVKYMGTKKVQVEDIGYPKMQTPQGQPIDDGVILKVLVSCICGSDLHTYNGRTSAQGGKLVLGHEITGEVFEMGEAVKNFRLGDWASVPFNIACGTCENCKSMKWNACETTNPEGPGQQCGIYGYPLSGGWQGGQAEYVLVPHADINLLLLPERVKHEKDLLRDIATLSDAWPTAMHGVAEAFQGNMGFGRSVYIAGAGPIGLLALINCQMIGCSNIFVGDVRSNRLEAVKNLGGIPMDLSKISRKEMCDFIKEHNDGVPFVHGAVECVGFEASETGKGVGAPDPESALNDCIEVTKGGGNVGVIGAFLPSDPGGKYLYDAWDKRHYSASDAPGTNKEPIFHLHCSVAPAVGDLQHKLGKYTLRYGDSWFRNQTLHGGQAAVMRYNKYLLNNLMADKVRVANAINVKVISLDDAPEAYAKFADGEFVKYVIDPHNTLGKVTGPAFTGVKMEEKTQP